MTVLQENAATRGKFYILHDGAEAAAMTYTWSGPDRIIIDHTEVSDVLRGTGAGKQMVAQAVAFARDHHIRILPLCPFAKSVFDKEVEFRDVLFH
ncbi:MAG: GNAT family N-acetyltransferase [Chitinophagales bacterium]